MANRYKSVFIIENGKVVEILSTFQFMRQVNDFYRHAGVDDYVYNFTDAMYLYLKRNQHLVIRYGNKFWRYFNDENSEGIESVGVHQ